MGTIGFADRLRFPRLPNELGKRAMIAFAHIPTGAVANKGFDVDELNSKIVKLVISRTATGADIEIGRATP